MIPYVDVSEIPLWGDQTIALFGTLVAVGILVGVAWAYYRASVVGIPREDFSEAIVWTLFCGFLVSHLVAIAIDPRPLGSHELGFYLQFWNGMSSFGGFFGALLGAWIYFRRSGRPWLVHAEIMIQALVVGWIFGRLGCAVVHDHIGRLSDFPLAVRFPGGARHDLGLYEFLYTLLVLVPAILWVNRRPRPAGTTVWVMALLYAPARFLGDFLRHTDLPGADSRYLGLTLAQYGCIALAGIGVTFFRRTRRYPATGSPGA
jgi:phosphatidylglycerol:prolipoprotein diacylglycerol transferase